MSLSAQNFLASSRDILGRRARTSTTWACLLALFTLLYGARSLVLCVHVGGRVTLESATEALLCCHHDSTTPSLEPAGGDGCLDTPLLRSLETTSKSAFVLDAVLPAGLPLASRHRPGRVVSSGQHSRSDDFQRLRSSVVLQR